MPKLENLHLQTCRDTDPVQSLRQAVQQTIISQNEAVLMPFSAMEVLSFP